MKKHRFLLLAVALSVFLSSCTLIDNGITPFGDVSFPGNDNFFFSDDTSRIEVNGTVYYNVGTAADGVRKGEYMAAVTGRDFYSYRFYKPVDSSLEGILIVNLYSIVNIVCCYDIFASADAVDIPAELLYDFPHRDEWWNGGQITEMNGVNYCSYGSTEANTVKPGEKAFEANGKTYYFFPNEPLWVMCRNQSDADRYDLYYDVDSVNELPIAVVMAQFSKP